MSGLCNLQTACLPKADRVSQSSVNLSSIARPIARCMLGQALLTDYMSAPTVHTLHELPDAALHLLAPTLPVIG